MLFRKIVENILTEHFVKNDETELVLEEGTILSDLGVGLSKEDLLLFLDFFHIDMTRNTCQVVIHKLFYTPEEYKNNDSKYKTFLNLKVIATEKIIQGKPSFVLHIHKMIFKQPKAIPTDILTFPNNNYQGHILIVGKHSDLLIKNKLKSALVNYFSQLDVDLSIDTIKDLNDFDDLVSKKQNKVSICELHQQSNQFSEMMKRLESLSPKDIEKYPIHLIKMLVFFERVKKVIFISHIEKIETKKEYLVHFSYLDFTQDKKIIDTIHEYLQNEKTYYLAKNIKENGSEKEIDTLSFSQRIKDYDELKTEAFEKLNTYFNSLTYKKLCAIFPY